MLIIASSELLSSPPFVVDQLPVALAWNSSSTGLVVIMRTVPAIELALARFKEVVALSAQADELAEKLENRKIIDRAKGKLMDEHAMTENDAFRFVQQQAMSARCGMADIAAKILDGELGPT